MSADFGYHPALRNPDVDLTEEEEDAILESLGMLRGMFFPGLSPRESRYWLDKQQVPHQVQCDRHLVRSMHQTGRRVDRTHFTEEIYVSTVFTGFNYARSDTDTPRVFETMCFGFRSDYQRRWRTWQEAQKGHDAVVALMRLEDLPKEPDKPEESYDLAELNRLVASDPNKEE
jgi:hypothetical protein